MHVSQLNPLRLFRSNGQGSSGGPGADPCRQEEAGADTRHMPQHGAGEMPPWKAARRQYSGVYSDIAKSRRSWKYLSFGLMALLALVTVSLIGFATSSRVEPYVIEKDQLGRIRYAGPLPARPETPDERLIRAELRRLTNDLRTVTTDQGIQDQLINRSFGVHVREEARAYLSQYFSQEGQNPTKLGEKIRRTVNVTSVLPVPESDTWKVEWVETTTTLGGGEPKKTAWEAYLGVEHQDPESQKEAAQNPLGLYVTSIEWTQVGAGPDARSETGSSGTGSDNASPSGTSRSGPAQGGAATQNPNAPPGPTRQQQRSSPEETQSQ